MEEQQEAPRRAPFLVSLKDWRLNSYDPRMRGVERITGDGVEVPADRLPELEKRARKSGVELRVENAEDASEDTEREEQ